MKEHDMTHTIEPLELPGNWEALLAEAGIDYVEVGACPDEACKLCLGKPEVAAAA